MKINDVIDEVSMKPATLQRFAGSDAVSEMTMGWEAEMIVPGLRTPSRTDRRVRDDDHEDYTHDWSYDGPLPIPQGIDKIDFMPWKRKMENFFCHHGDVENGTLLVDRVTDDFEDDYENWLIEKLEDDPSITPVIRQHIAQLLDSDVAAEINAAFYDKGRIYDRAVGETLREMKKLNLWQEFMKEHSITSYKEFARHYNLDWPYTRAAEKHLEYSDIADSFTSGRMEVSKDYHGAERRPGVWYIEPDESIEAPDDYGSAEIISPKMSAPKALSQLPDFLTWCSRIGAEGHETSGFHINIGPPSQNTEDIDAVKLILFLGDNYVLSEFGRLLSKHGQTYAKSTINKMRELLTTDIEKQKFDPQRVINSLKSFAVPAAAAMLSKFSKMPGRKYSINIKDEYVEFRAAGSDWMSKRQELMNTVNRCLYVMALAADPYAEQREYAIKLYKLLQSSMNPDQEEELDETLKRVKGKWALVSRKNPKKVLQYYHGSGHPSKEWVNKVERRVHSFSEDTLEESADLEETLVDDSIDHDDVNRNKLIAAASHLSDGNPELFLIKISQLSSRGRLADLSEILVKHRSELLQTLQQKLKKCQVKPNIDYLLSIKDSVETLEKLGGNWPEVKLILRKIQSLIEEYYRGRYTETVLESAASDAIILKTIKIVLLAAATDLGGYGQHWLSQDWIYHTAKLSANRPLPDLSEDLLSCKKNLISMFIQKMQDLTSPKSPAVIRKLQLIKKSINITKQLGADWPELELLNKRIDKLIADNENAIAEEINWQDIKRKAAGAALAGGLVGAAALGIGNKAPSVPQQPAAITQPAAVQAPGIAAPAEPERAAAMNPAKGDNPNFPAALKDIHKADSKTRVDTFTRVMLPAIDAQNSHIKAQRAALLQLSKAKRYTPEQQQWINDMMAQYHADDLQDLLKRVDIIPRSIALAQAAIESGWGTDPKTQKANVFYGQKTWSKTDGVEGPYGERYAGFESPEAAVKAYMKNLNTHDAYEKFRDQRAQLRRAGKDISGKHLIHSLDKYSTLGKKYTSNVNNIITSKGLDKLD